MKISALLLLLLVVVPHTNAFIFDFLGLFDPFNLFHNPGSSTGGQRQAPDVKQKGFRSETPDFGRIVRSIDGSGNNRRVPNLGKAASQMPRLTQAAYSDGKAKMIDRGNPRELSNIIGSFGSAEKVHLNQYGLNMLFVLFGQFIDHDLDLTLPSGTEKALINVPRGDASFDPNREGNKTIQFSRSKFTEKDGKRSFPNELTSFIDGSQVYGSDAATMKNLREFKGGKLKMLNNLLIKDKNGSFLAGDVRVNENIGLTSIHTIFAREHNLQCQIFATKFPGLNDEDLFQMARNMVIGFIQKITLKDYLPLLLGEDAFSQFVGKYKGYDERINPTVNLQFSTAAFRIGHPLLVNGLNIFDYFNKKIKSISMKDMFLSFQQVKKAEDIDFTMNGMLRTQCKQRNHQLVDGVRNLLVESPGIIQDLFALNVQRGRDHGMHDYNSVRDILGYPRLKIFSELTSDKVTVQRLAKGYGNVDNIDLWVGIISEEPMKGGILGKVGAAIVGETFKRVRNGDRFWYESAYPQDIVEEIEKTSFRDIILRNTKLSNIPQGFKIPGFENKIDFFQVDQDKAVNINVIAKTFKTSQPGNQNTQFFNVSQNGSAKVIVNAKTSSGGTKINQNTQFFTGGQAGTTVTTANTGATDNIQFVGIPSGQSTPNQDLRNIFTSNGNNLP